MEHEHHEGAGQHERETCGKSAQGAVQQPADIGRKLRGLWPRQQHAEIMRVQETSSLIQRRSATRTRGIEAIWPAGPPKDKTPILAHTASASLKEGFWVDEVDAGEVFDPMTTHSAK